MGRAPNPGAPQRVSAHVVPKAAAFSAEDDEKTTIESGGWEEEASTTVEQGEVADKLRALGALGDAARRSGSNTNITSTNGSGVSDEPTVDDQRASAALALLPPPSVARLVVTGGNDSGRSLEVRPGKTYTIGRGVDNDLVLTDITASRKHFDLRNENGSWILADRGSGNGTLINSRIEDAPFMLASGDTIEVGNTAFRFDLISSAISLPGLPRELPSASRRDAPSVANGRAAPVSDLPRLNPEDPDSVDLATPAVGPERPVAREPPAPAGPRDAAAASMVRGAAEPHEPANGVPREVPTIPTYDGSVDDEIELSTVSGKPLPGAEPPRPAVTAGRPKTLPPPAPPQRPRTQTGRPPVGPVGYALDRPRSQQMAVAPLLLPPQPPQPPSALAAAMAPTMGPAMAHAMAHAIALPVSPMHAPALLPLPATTLPLPQMANRPPLSPALLDPSLGPLPTTIPGQGPPVPARGPRLPFSYPSATEIISQHAVSQHAVSQHAAGNPRGPVHVTVHAGRDATSTALVQPISYSGRQEAIAPRAQRARPQLSRRTKIALGIIGLGLFAAIVTLAALKGANRSDTAETSGAIPPKPPAAPDRVTVATPKAAPDRVTVATPKADQPPMLTPIQPVAPATPATGSGGSGSSTIPPRIDKPISPVAPATPSPGIAQTAPPTHPTSVAPPPPTRTDKIAQTAPPAPPPPAATHPPVEPEAATEAAPPPTASTRSDPRDRTDHNDKKPPKRGDTRRPDRTDHSDKKPVEIAAAAPRNDRKRGGRNLQDIKAEANALYKGRNFSGAAGLLTSSLSGFGSDDAKELKSIAAIYTQLGRAYNIGMAPGTKPTEAYQALRRAIDYDRDVGSAYVSEMQDKLVGMASRAASSYMASHEYELAFQAVRMAESLGSKSSNNQTVRTLLEDTANDLYRTASSELSTDPEGAKKKLRQILGMVDTRNPLYAKAQKLLNAP